MATHMRVRYSKATASKGWREMEEECPTGSVSGDHGIHVLFESEIPQPGWGVINL